ncbi:alpha/beta hydrolase [Candidatus Saccharibacteria bacterium]|nr:alpha/beta hydrolase [Candidatus Saccharibacteria bacterium]
MVKTANAAAESIRPLYMNGLSGRMIKLPPPRGKRREILLISGHHTSIERIFGLAEYLNRYGGVTSPDLPGFGGMDPFHKIGEKPTLDNMADYLAAFVKLRYKKNRRFTIMAVSYGFSVATRMLQKYPDIAKRVDALVSISGYTHKADFRWKKSSILLLGGAAWTVSFAPMSFFVKHTLLRAPVIKLLYRAAEKRHPKLKGVGNEERDERINFEIKLWRINDLRTYTYVSSRGFRMVPAKKHVDLVVHHVAIEDDHYFDNLLVEEHMRTIYKDFVLVKTKLPVHAPTVLATPKDVAPFVPPKIRALLRRQP